MILQQYLSAQFIHLLTIGNEYSLVIDPDIFKPSTEVQHQRKKVKRREMRKDEKDDIHKLTTWSLWRNFVIKGRIDRGISEIAGSVIELS